MRDYIHVLDLGDAHLAALDALDTGQTVGAMNLGTGAGYSVLSVDDGISTADDSGFGLVGGLGYDLRVGKNLSITPVANYFRGAFDGGSANVLQLGVGVTSH